MSDKKNQKIYRERTTIYIEMSIWDVPSVVVFSGAVSEKVSKIHVRFKKVDINLQQKYKINVTNINVIQTICSSYFWFCGWKLKNKKRFKEAAINLLRQISATMVSTSMLHVPSVVVTCGANKKWKKKINIRFERKLQ